MHIQKYEEDNVLVATQKRIKFLFDNYKNVIISVSGGKDSTIIAHLGVEEAKRQNRNVGVFFFDEEVVYESTIEQVDYLMTLDKTHITKMWMQIEFNLTNSTSYDEPYLTAWETNKSKLWMHKKKSYAIKHKKWDESTEKIANKEIGLDFYDVIHNWENTYKDTAFIIGLRTEESLNRWRSVMKNPVNVNGEDIYWATGKPNNCVSCYPIYDWKFQDVWKYIYDNDLKYSKIYDYQYKKGFNIPDMRISSLIHEKSFKSIQELPEFEPRTYNKLVKRIKGIQMAQETAKDKKLFQVQKLPKNYKSWKEYRDFLIMTFQNSDKRDIFIKRFNKHLENEYVARQQCRQLVLNDYENNLPVNNQEDPKEVKRQELIKYYTEIL